MPKNVVGTELVQCGCEPMTGFLRDGFCRTGGDDFGVHVVCAKMTEAFLQFTCDMGNDLSTPNPDWGFPGLEPGDAWCLCVSRWKEALQAGCAPPVFLEATHMSALEYVTLEELQAHATG